MTLDEARAILKGQLGSIDNLGPEYVQRVYAAETICDHYRAHPEPCMPCSTIRSTT
jgi:hypothetical protein